MSYFDDASLVMIPSGYKDGKVYSVKPTDGSGDLTFSRGSDIEATRVNANGYIEKAQVNLLLQSNQFDTTWATTNSTLTSGQTGYDGSSDAWKVDISAAAGKIQQSVSTSGVQAISVYAKAGSVNFMRISIDGGNGQYFNLSTGSLGTQLGTIIDANIESIGSGWFRCSVVANQAITAVPIYPAVADNDLTGTSGNIYIQDAQINYGLVAQTYQETTTAAVVSGITNDMPRLNYDPANPTCPSLLLEPSRTNLVTQSEYFGAWGATNVTVTNNNTTSPEGVVNGAKIERTASGGYVSLNASATGTQSYSVYAKAGDLNYVRLLALGTGNPNVYFNLSNGTVGTATAATGSIEAYSNGWYRCTIVYNTTITAVRAYPAETDASTGGANGYVYTYGAQLESSASYSTSYLPTYGSSATRTADAAYKTGISSLIGQSEGTIFLEVERDGAVSFENLLFLGDGNLNNFVNVVYDNSVNRYKGQVRSGGITDGIVTAQSAYTGRLKIAVAYAVNDLVLYINGVLQQTDTSVTLPSTTLSVMGVGSYYTTTYGTDIFRGDFHQMLLFKTRLPNSDLATLTSL